MSTAAFTSELVRFGCVPEELFSTFFFVEVCFSLVVRASVIPKWDLGWVVAQRAGPVEAAPRGHSQPQGPMEQSRGRNPKD